MYQFSNRNYYRTETLCDPPSPPQPPVIELGLDHFNSSEAKYHVSDSLGLYCKEGYEPVFGDHVTTCLNNGSWSRVTLVCEGKYDCYSEIRAIGLLLRNVGPQGVFFFALQKYGVGYQKCLVVRR